ncbi:MAG: PRC-barrel domain-containing protein [Alphaproteobacteria bacterium]|nr:PRC-barrel domain-containing protein [Alphaproteobacteria bacterium]
MKSKLMVTAAALALVAGGTAFAQMTGPAYPTAPRADAMGNAPGTRTDATSPAQSRPGATEAGSERTRDSGTAFPPTASTGTTAGAPATRYAPDTARPYFPPAGATAVPVSRLVGQPVFDRDGQQLGTVREVELYPGTSMAVIAMAEGRSTAVPLHYMMHGANGHLMVNGSREHIDRLPPYHSSMN